MAVPVPPAGPHGTVASIQLCRAHGERPVHVPEAMAVPGGGLAGDVHSGRSGSSRSVLLLDTDTVAELGLRPGDLREQVTVDLPGLQALPAGTRLRLGEATVEITGPCGPCTHIGQLLGVEDPGAFKDHLEGRRGVLARVPDGGGGRISLGAAVEVVDANATRASPATSATSRDTS